MPPGPPHDVMVESIGSTWAVLQWQVPMEKGHPDILHYIVIAVVPDVTTALVAKTPDNSTTFNVTNLIPDTSYNFSVQGDTCALGVEAIGDSSNVVKGITDVTGNLHIVHTCTCMDASRQRIRK